MALRIALIGYGKMGRAVEQVATGRGHTVSAVITRTTPTPYGREVLGDADVAVEFSVPDAAVPNAVACLRAGVPVVVGTTGWMPALETLTREVETTGGALLWAPNFSLGVQLLADLVERLGRLTPERRGFATQLIETHHVAKQDAPSGTAAMLARLYADGAGRPLSTTSIRVGYVPGRHELLVDGPFELLRLVHEARDRRVFADGAVTAAEWLARGGRRGVFTLRDVLADNMGTEA